MPRQLDTTTLDRAAEFYAAEFLRHTRWSGNGTPTPRWAGYGVFDRVALGGRDFVVQSLYNATFKDEHNYLRDQLKEWMGRKALEEFERIEREIFSPREDGVFRDLLLERLAVDPDGNHVEGAIGKVQVGVRPIRRRLYEVETLASIRRRKQAGLPIHVLGREDRETEWREMWEVWPIYAGEGEERAADRIKAEIGAKGPGADPLPPGTPGLPLGANVTNISAEAAVAAIDAAADKLDEGSTAAEIRGRTGSQPADPDASETGTLLFTLPMSDPAFNAGSDDGDGSVSASADTITDDSSADATGTLGYCRFAATGTGADDHIDGNATTDGTGATDWNTLSIVSGSTVSMTSASLGMSQGSTAS